MRTNTLLLLEPTKTTERIKNIIAFEEFESDSEFGLSH
jgi:hypothetical protein